MDNELAKIVEGCRSGDHSAYKLLFKRYYRQLLGIALRYSRNREEAEDTVQDAFIKIFQGIGSYRDSGSFEGWIKRIVQYTAINSYKNNLRSHMHVDICDTETELSDKSFEQFFYDFDPEEIIGFLQQLPEGYRMVVNLYFIDGYSHKEISGMLDISTGTSKSQLFKAKNFLRHLMITTNQEKNHE
ncbi:MAG: polymerase, sigma-24 subunit, subfamily protein [Bacteroidetes bacterium]|jgi:RNA polymerase sigma-70 factor (ECF subfamily)|nr:polymerase, sigma-24 subunit, subfamily protein [Bacteroidota bacterium]